jgi:hypothetical protein
MPRQIAGPLRDAGFVVATVEEAGLKGVDNGRLLRAVEGRFDVLLTADQNVYAQQNLRGRQAAIVTVPTNRKRTIMERAADIVAALRQARPGTHVRITADGRVTLQAHADPAAPPGELPPVGRFGPRGWA